MSKLTRRVGFLMVAFAGLFGLPERAEAQWQGPPSVVDPDMFVWGEALPFWQDSLLYRTVHLNLYWGGHIHGAYRA